VTRPVAVFRFSATEVPAYLGDWLDAQRAPWTTVAIDEGAAVPADPRAFAGIAMMGGPMSVNDPLPWIEPLCALLRAAIATDVPIIGHCLGGQLLAKALGAEVGRARSPEIGWIDVATDDDGARREWFGGRAAFTSFQWHYDAFALPPGATRVLTNANNANQAFVVNDRHIGLQCHVEMTRPLTETWLATSRDELPAASTPSAQSASEIARDLDARIGRLHTVAADIYARWGRGLKR
jgi:GMP synthase-like glutamine amidotransferase